MKARWIEFKDRFRDGIHWFGIQLAWDNGGEDRELKDPKEIEKRIKEKVDDYNEKLKPLGRCPPWLVQKWFDYQETLVGTENT